MCNPKWQSVCSMRFLLLTFLFSFEMSVLRVITLDGFSAELRVATVDDGNSDGVDCHGADDENNSFDEDVAR